MADKIIASLLLQKHAAHDVDNSKLLADINIDIFNVPVFGKYESTRPFFKEIHAHNLVAFIEYKYINSSSVA